MFRKPKAWRWASLLVLFCLAACAKIPSPEERRRATYRLLDEQGWTRQRIETNPFIMEAFLPPPRAEAGQAVGGGLTVYIEGDGLAWSSYTKPSDDPTPEYPMAIMLAMAQRQGRAVALARPCQYTMDVSRGGCEARYWTSHRFAPEVVSATDQAVSQLKALSGATWLRLVGYSGGGAVAALVAARRDDVRELLTVAGNLDHAAWTKHHHLSPLSGSLQPVDAAPGLTHLPQLHFIGSEDQIIPPSLARNFLEKQGRTTCASIVVVQGPDHEHGWVQRWEALLQTPFPCVHP